MTVFARPLQFGASKRFLTQPMCSLCCFSTTGSSDREFHLSLSNQASLAQFKVGANSFSCIDLKGDSDALEYLDKSSIVGVPVAISLKGICASLAQWAHTRAMFAPADTPPSEMLLGSMLNFCAPFLNTY